MSVRSRRGFTLIELLVALVVSGILSGVIFQLLQGQSRFARLQTAREEVQQNARVALELASSELRGIAPGALLVAKADSVKFALPRAWGIVCDYKSDGREISAQFPLSANASFRTGGDKPPDSLAIRNVDGAWISIEARDETDGTGDKARTACNNDPVNANLPVEDPDVSRARFFHVPDNPVSAAGEEYAPGMRLYLFDWVTYDVGPASVPGQWIRRTLNGGAPQPVAGPLPPDAGLTFRFFDGAGNPVTPTTATERNNVASIHVRVTTNSRATFNGVAQHQSDSTTIYLRNRLCTPLGCS